jgi:hypothetical protein
MNRYAATALTALALLAAPLWAQDDDSPVENIVVTATRSSNMNAYSTPVSTIGYTDRRPVIGLKRKADSVVRTITIVSDSREEDMRKREVEAMLLAALDMADREGLSLVTGTYEVTVVTKANWRDLFPGLVGKGASDEDDEDDDDDDESTVAPGFVDNGNTATITLKVKTKLTGSIAEAQGKITRFVKKVPPNGRAQMAQQGGLALTIIQPEQYRDEIYRRIAAGTKHAIEFYGPDYGAEITGLDREIKWEQANASEVFLFIPYSFTVRK